jgi:transcriptional regulator with GAF, ATPase, and Fis domain
VVALSSAGTTAALVDAIGAALFAHIGFSSLALVRPGKAQPEFVGACELPGTALAKRGITIGADGPAAQALATGRAIVCPTAAAFAEAFPSTTKAAARAKSEVGSAVAFPLSRGGRVVGALVATSPLPGVSDETALRALEAAGRVCAIRLDLESAFAGGVKAEVAAGDSVLMTGAAVAV